MYNLNSIIATILQFGDLQNVTNVKKKKPAHMGLVFASFNNCIKDLFLLRVEQQR